MEQEKCISGAFYNVNEIYLYSNQHMHITHNTRFRTLKQFLFLFILFLSIFCLRHFFSFFFSFGSLFLEFFDEFVWLFFLSSFVARLRKEEDGKNIESEPAYSFSFYTMAMMVVMAFLRCIYRLCEFNEEH